MRKKQVVRRYVKESRHAASAVAVALILVAAVASGQDSLVPHVEKGREAFLRVCGACHGTEKPESKNMERPAWDELIRSMEAKGAKLTEEERELILDYLGIRNVFLTKCTVCHSTERILDRSQSFSGWQGIVEAMAAKRPELMTQGEARSIVAYLSVVRGEEPAAR